MRLKKVMGGLVFEGLFIGGKRLGSKVKKVGYKGRRKEGFGTIMECVEKVRGRWWEHCNGELVFLRFTWRNVLCCC